jgi:DNA-binding ferritin-like protein
MDKHIKIAALYIAALEAVALIHTRNHWISKGNAFYGDHLLFERIYKTALEDFDSAAERFVGLFGTDVLDYQTHVALISGVMSKYKLVSGSPAAQSLAAEQGFLKLASDAYKSFEETGHLTLGLEDLMPAISSSRESAIYLLKQKLAEEE